MINYFPKYLSNRAVIAYFVTIIVALLLYSDFFMKWYYCLIGSTAILIFFYGFNYYTRHWANISDTKFKKEIFWWGFCLRLICMLFLYYFFYEQYGSPFEYKAADSYVYNKRAIIIADSLRNGNYSIFKTFYNIYGFSDIGYVSYLGVVYSFTGNSIIFARILKVLYSAVTCVLIYQLALRSFGRNVARIAAVACMLMPNLIVYCGLHLKETEMIFLLVLYIERMDKILRDGKLKLLPFILLLFLGSLLFLFRTVLGVVCFLSLAVYFVLSKERMSRNGKMVLLGLICLIFGALVFGSTITEEVEGVWNRKGNQQETLEWRSQRRGGNQWARYAGATIFAPMIFTIPFPTIIHMDAKSEYLYRNGRPEKIPGHYTQVLMHGGYFVKNVMSFFLIFSLICLLMNGEWKKNVLPLACMLGYLLAIALSPFAQSERFHLPALPFYLMFMSYGLSKIENKHKKYFNMYLIFICICIIGWNYFKLAGRSLI